MCLAPFRNGRLLQCLQSSHFFFLPCRHGGQDIILALDNAEEFLELQYKFILEEGIQAQLDALHAGACVLLVSACACAYACVASRFPCWTVHVADNAEPRHRETHRIAVCSTHSRLLSSDEPIECVCPGRFCKLVPIQHESTKMHHSHVSLIAARHVCTLLVVGAEGLGSAGYMRNNAR